MSAPAERELAAALRAMLASPDELREAFADGLQPDPDLTVSQWADTYRVLPSESAAEYGRWRTERVPFMREVMDAQSPTHPCTESSLIKGTQLGASEAMYNVLGFAMHLCPSPNLMVLPTVEMGKLVSKQRIQTMIDCCPELLERVAPARSRDSSNTVLVKKYRGGLLRITGANSGPGLRNMPVRFLLLDEVDAYPTDVAGEGDPCAVAEKRTTNYGSRKKIFRASSPKLKGSSRIHRYYLAGTQARYEVPCPHCQHEQALVWDQMRWAMVKRRELICKACGAVSAPAAGAGACQECGAPCAAEQISLVDTEDMERVWYECASCQGEIEERHKPRMLATGRHVHRMPGPGRALADNDPHAHAIWARIDGKVQRFLPTFARPLSWHVSALYSPLGWYSWADAVSEYLESQKGGFDDETGESLEQVFWNTALGEPYEIQGEQADLNILSTRAEPYDLGSVPAGGLLLVAAIDVQGNRLEYKCKAFGRGEESWLVDYQVLHGDPTLTGSGSVWDQASQLRNRAYRHAGGESVYISAMVVDSGYLTQTVYDFCRKWARQHVYAIKGDEGPGKPVIGPERKVDFNHRGRPIKNGATVRIVGTDTVKERAFANLAISVPGPGYLHFPRGLPDEYFAQLTAEKKIPRQKKGRTVYEYHKTRERNEALDLEVYCYAAAVLAGLKRVNWDQLERVINPAQRDIFANPIAAPVKTSALKAADAAPAPTPESTPEPTPVPTPEAATSEHSFVNGGKPRKSNWVTDWGGSR